ncbi:hypothetical protein WR25_24700 [Diploscapter pachys]|uniref:Tetraspanin n=1 Tax=Diploscapter pachys TaxID=2018661 RepID=A0A2A2L5F4_9BILA|nr:hypothetical protein WR25_24700 [Diploscapter pachys]
MDFCANVGSVSVGIGKRVIGFRLEPITATMMVVSVQTCLIFTALSLAFSYIDRDMASTVFGSADYRIFLLVYASLASITSLLFLVIIFVGLYGYLPHKKKLIVASFFFQITLFFPLSVSGLFLHSQMWYKGATLLNNHTRENFERMIDATARLQMHRHAKTQPTIKVPYNLTHLHNTISEVQRTYCCCGLNDAEDYGPKFKPTHNVNWNLSVLLFIDGKVENMSCPSMQFDSKSSCAVALFRGCEWAILHTQINIVQWLSVERQRARATAIRIWRANLHEQLYKERSKYQKQKLAGSQSRSIARSSSASKQEKRAVQKNNNKVSPSASKQSQQNKAKEQNGHEEKVEEREIK